MESGPLTEETAVPVGVSRRTMVTAAAWAVPAISVATAVPAWASSTSTSQVALTVPNNQLPASGATPVTATVTDQQGNPQAGQPVSLTGPSGSVIAAPNGVTDGAGQYATTIDLSDPWKYPGSTVTLTALSGDGSTSLPVTVLGSNLITGKTIWDSTLVQGSLVFPSPVVDYSQRLRLAVLADGSVWKGGPNWVVMPEVTDGAQLSTTASNEDADRRNSTSAYVLKKDGTIVGWGMNTYGQLGDGTTTPQSSPVAFQGLSDVVQIQAGKNGFHALKSDGTVWYQGMLTATSGTPGYPPDRYFTAIPLSQVGLDAQAIRIVNLVGYGAGAILQDGTVWVWGDNLDIQVGDRRSQPTPVQIVGLSGVTALVGAPVFGQAHLGSWMALRSDGTVWTWGQNDWGQLGYGGTTTSTVATQVPGVSDVVQVAMLPSAAYALKSDGTLLAWGRMPGGVNQSTPSPVTVPTSPPIRTLIDVRGSAYLSDPAGAGGDQVALITEPPALRLPTGGVRGL